jgi:hypothetical protein
MDRCPKGALNSSSTSPDLLQYLMRHLRLPNYAKSQICEASNGIVRFQNEHLFEGAHSTGRMKLGCQTLLVLRIDLGFFVNFKTDVSVRDSYVLVVSTSESWIRGLLLVQSEFPAQDELPSFLETAQSMTSHSVLLPIVLSEIVADFAGENIRKCDEMLDNLELQTGQHGRMSKPTGDILGLDFTKITRIQNTVNTVLGRSERSLKSTMHLLESCSSSILLLENKGIDSCIGDFDRESSLALQKENLRSRCKNFLLNLEFNQKRVQSQLVAVRHQMI